ncbi:uncharacterized protein LOC115338213, partial [Aquila chrysaetos chrysaetos]|uniref:uncharacterized protein LOC115338213 n=1 Tax=Aquila chrysaetos chrysaetos TaxID=223781 RepID=UPI001176C8EA
MAEEVVYADLRVPGGTAGTPTRGRCPRGCPLSPSLALAGGLILGVTIGVLGVLGDVLGAASGRPTGTPIPTAPACNGSAAELAAALRRDLCEEDDGARGRPKAPCGLCPPRLDPPSCCLLPNFGSRPYLGRCCPRLRRPRCPTAQPPRLPGCGLPGGGDGGTEPPLGGAAFSCPHLDLARRLPAAPTDRAARGPGPGLRGATTGSLGVGKLRGRAGGRAQIQCFSEAQLAVCTSASP